MIDYEGPAQPSLSPRMLDKIADTMNRKLGGGVTASDAQAWWDFTWPDFEGYLERYKDHGRAILNWARRATLQDLERAREAARMKAERAELDKLRPMAEAVNERAEEQVPKGAFLRVVGKR